ncbi:hypothetical protein SAMN02745866_03089 [Alteromonadaceae bacterium Bs31]|nr:hypothetical protein SAMN02745866_03089 [Alteromonadaceae bacterium Bs31]
MKSKIVFLTLISLCESGTASDWQHSISANSFSYSEIAPIKQIFDDLRGPPLKKGDTAFTFNSLNIESSYKSLKLGIFSRYHYILNFTPDTAELIYADKNDRQLQENTPYLLDISADHVAASGLAIGYAKTFGNVQLELSASYLTANQMIDGRLSGYIQTNSDSTFDGEASLAYAYSNDIFFNRENSGISGQGYSFDAGLEWHINKHWIFRWKGKDINSEIKWSRQHFTSAQASSDNISYNRQGLISTRPVLSWIESAKNISQTLPSQHNAHLNYFWENNGIFGLEYYQFDAVNFYRITYAKTLMPETVFHSYYDLSSKALMVACQRKNLTISYAADKLLPEKAYTLEFKVAYAFTF